MRTVTRLAAGLTATITLACSLSSASASAAPVCSSLPIVIAHRGGTELHAENSLAAFDSAYRRGGSRLWETDVRFDAAGVPVILHDATLNRTTPRTGRIAKTQASGAHRVKLDDGQNLPTLWELLNLAKHDGARTLLELKVMPASAKQWAAFFNRIDITTGRSRVTVTSFDRTVLAAVRKHDPKIKTAWIDGWGNPGVAAITAQGATYMKYHPAMTKARFTAWHAAGITIFAWTVDSPAGWAREAGYPVDGIITDKPIAYRDWLTATCGATVAG